MSRTTRVDQQWWATTPVSGGCIPALDWAPDADRRDHVAALAERYAAGRPIVDDVHTDPAAGWALAVAGAWEPLDYLRTTLGENIAIESARLYHRPMGASGAVPLHQDGGAPGRLLDPYRSASVLFVLDGAARIDLVQALPRSHTAGYVAHRPSLDDGAFALHPAAEVPTATAPRTAASAPGQAVLLDVRTIRGIGATAAPGMPWTVLAVCYVAPGGIIRRPAGAPPLLIARGSSSAFRAIR